MVGNPTTSDSEPREAPSEWDEKGELPDDTPVAKKGALWYLINDGEPISEGYHEIRVTAQGWVGKLGAKEEVIKL